MASYKVTVKNEAEGLDTTLSHHWRERTNLFIHGAFFIFL